ncbi:MAG TPA: hypothetical protein PLY93_12410, partial [Turneriella sp.]|nr:hypothetical protein [Turneriella sp.]
RAAKANGGIVIAVVGKVVDSFTAERLLSSHEVDYIIVDPYAEQIGGIPLNDAWSLFLPRTQSVSAADFKEAYAALRLINKVAGITSERDASAQMVARLGARVLQENIKEGALVNLGVGLPEEVAGIYCDEGRSEEVLFTVEGGAMGGLPAPGVFFGASLYPQKLTSSTTTFARYREGLDATVLGFLQIDAEGNVNVSRRGADGSAKTAIGPGGFIDICEGAKLIIFMGSSRVRGKVEITPNGVKILPGGKPKLVPRLDEVTFSAKRALQKGKQVFYATDFGLLRLTENGLELIEVFRGIDIERDIERTQLIPIDVSRVKKRRIQI